MSLPLPRTPSETLKGKRGEGVCIGSHEEAWHDVSGSSFRINLGAGFAPLLLDEGEVITATFKLFNGGFEMFYKQDEKAMYSPTNE